MNKYEEIKSLLEASRSVLKKNMNESQNKEILKKYQIINERNVEIDTIEKFQDKQGMSIKKDSDEIGKKDEKQKGYKIQGNILILHGKDESQLELTTDEKNAFVESVDEFRNEVAELVEFGKMNVYPDNVEWSGKIMELHLEFFYTINEPNGIFINGNMMKLNQEYLDMVGKLQQNYEKFKTKWSKIVATRQKL
jgi:hypothetical protein